jgi:hypothetical protein
VPSTPIDTPKEGQQERLPVTLTQAARSVKLGQKVTAFVRHGDEDRVTGYLAGADDECWFILQPEVETERFRQILVSRRDAPVLEIHIERTYDQEPLRLRREMDRIVVHFRTWVSQNVLSGRS